MFENVRIFSAVLLFDMLADPQKVLQLSGLDRFVKGFIIL